MFAFFWFKTYFSFGWNADIFTVWGFIAAKLGSDIDAEDAAKHLLVIASDIDM